MQHLKIITHVNSNRMFDETIEKFKEEYPDIIIDSSEVSSSLLSDFECIALTVTKCAPNHIHCFYSEKAMESGDFDSTKIYQGEKFDACEIIHVSQYVDFSESGVELYDENEYLFGTFTSADKLLKFIKDKTHPTFVYFNNKTINLTELESDELNSLVYELFE